MKKNKKILKLQKAFSLINSSKAINLNQVIYNYKKTVDN